MKNPTVLFISTNISPFQIELANQVNSLNQIDYYVAFTFPSLAHRGKHWLSEQEKDNPKLIFPDQVGNDLYKFKAKTHTESPSLQWVQIKRAVQYSIPILILIRDPKDVAVSLIIRNPESTLLSILNSYIQYYTAIFPYKDKLVIVDFKDLIDDLASVIKSINHKFDTSFRESSPTKDDQDVIFAKISELSKVYVNGEKTKAAYPSSEKKALKDYWKTKINDPCLAPVLSTAYSVYKDILI